MVNEGAVRIDLPEDVGPGRVVKRRGLRNLMIMPILDGEDGYGITFGARLAFVNMAGRKNRLSFPLTGRPEAGRRRVRQPLAAGPISRVSFGGAIQRQKNPAFQIDDDRQRTWGRAERAIGHVRLGGDLGWQHVSFGGQTDNLRTFGGDVTFDTRIDPILPRNAVYALASVEHVTFDARPTTIRTRLEGRGYLGLIGQTVLAVRVVREDADEPLPAYLKSLLGGWSTLRGFRAGAFVGDTVVSESAELRIPLSSPLQIGKVGVSVFVDTGTAYNKGERYSDQSLHTGIGVSAAGRGHLPHERLRRARPRRRHPSQFWDRRDVLRTGSGVLRFRGSWGSGSLVPGSGVLGPAECEEPNLGTRTKHQEPETPEPRNLRMFVLIRSVPPSV